MEAVKVGCYYVCLLDGVLRHFQQYFSYIVAVSFIGGKNRRTRRKHGQVKLIKLYVMKFVSYLLHVVDFLRVIHQ
jgi:hypothetical protein